METEPQVSSQPQPSVEDKSLAAEIYKRNYTPYIIALVVVIVLAAIGGFWYKKSKRVEEPIACTEEAKICPDGSAVGRTGPNCEFVECPKVLSQMENDLKNLNVDNSKVKQEFKTTLPKVFDGPVWGIRESSCVEGGYDINPYAGQEVVMRSYESGESFNGDPIDLWVIFKDDKVICAYKAVGENSAAAPGIFPIISK